MATIARMNVALAMDAKDFESGLAKVQQSTESMTQKLQKAGTTLSLGVTAPLAGIATMALKSAGDFEASMNVLQSVSGATADDMAALTQQALDLGASTSFSAGEAAEAMLELGKAGFDTNAIMGAMPGVLSLAAAGNMDVGTAAAIAANAVNTFGLEASEATTVANMLAAAANASSADVSDLAAGFQMAGAVFASNNQSMSDLTTSMALLANAGVAGSDAGTSLKTMMMRLAAPTAEAASAMADLGLKVYDANGAMLPFEDIVGNLSVATSGLSDAQRNAALSTIFGADAIRAAVILADAGAEGFANMEVQVTAAGAAEEAAAARMAGLNGAMDYLQGSIDSVLISLGTQFLPMLANMLRGVADLATGFTTLSPELQNAAIAFAAVMAAAGPLMLAVTGIGAALGFLLSPIGLVVVGVAALAAAWATNFGGIQEITDAAWGTIQPALQEWATWLQATIPAALTTMQASLTAVLTPISWVAAAMLDAGVNSGEASEAIGALPAALQPVAVGFQNLVANITAAATMLQGFLAPAFARVQEAVAGIGPQLGALSGPLASLQESFATLWTVVQPILTQLATALGVTLAVAADVGINTIAAVIANLPALIGPAINQVTATIALIATTLQGTTDLVTALINGDWSGAWAAAQSIFGGFATFFNATVGNLSAIATAVFTTIGQVVVQTMTDMGVDVQGTLQSLSTFWAGIWDTMSKAVEPVMLAIDGLKTGIQDFASWLGGISIPNPFAGISFPSLPAGFNPFGGGAAAPTGQASGGPVSAGVPYIIGERGREMFVPNVNGQIIPNNELGGWAADLVGAGAGGGGPMIGVANVYNQVDIRALAYQVAEYQARRR